MASDHLECAHCADLLGDCDRVGDGEVTKMLAHLWLHHPTLLRYPDTAPPDWLLLHVHVRHAL